MYGPSTLGCGLLLMNVSSDQPIKSGFRRSLRHQWGSPYISPVTYTALALRSVPPPLHAPTRSCTRRLRQESSVELGRRPCRIDWSCRLGVWVVVDIRSCEPMSATGDGAGAGAGTHPTSASGT